VLHQRINQVFRDAVVFDARVDLVMMIAVITQRIEDLRERQVWQMLRNLFRRRAHSPDLNDCSNRCAGVFNDWLAAQNLSVGDDILMFCLFCHNQSAVKSEADKLSRSIILGSNILSKGIIPNRMSLSRILSAY